jgi:hypothetical protein
MVAARLGVIGVVGVTDTLLVSPGLRPATDSVRWLRIVTISDGVARDSIAIRRGQLFSKSGFPAPAGGRIALVNRGVGGVVIYLMDRSGRTTDSAGGLSHASSCPLDATGRRAAVANRSGSWESAVFGTGPRAGTFHCGSAPSEPRREVRRTCRHPAAARALAASSQVSGATGLRS